MHTERSSVRFEVKEGVDELDLTDIQLDPPKDPRADALKKRAAELAAEGKK